MVALVLRQSFLVAALLTLVVAVEAQDLHIPLEPAAPAVVETGQPALRILLAQRTQAVVVAQEDLPRQLITLAHPAAPASSS